MRLRGPEASLAERACFELAPKATAMGNVDRINLILFEDKYNTHLF